MNYRSANFADGASVAWSIKKVFLIPSLSTEIVVGDTLIILNIAVFRGISLFFDSVAGRSAANVVIGHHSRQMPSRRASKSGTLRFYRP